MLETIAESSIDKVCQWRMLFALTVAAGRLDTLLLLANDACASSHISMRMHETGTHVLCCTVSVAGGVRFVCYDYMCCAVER